MRMALPEGQVWKYLLGREMRRRALRRKILSKYDTIADFAKDMGVSRQTITNWLSGGTITSSRMAEIKNKLGVGDEEIGKVFFNET